MKKIALTNGVSFGCVIEADDTTPFEVQFVGASGQPVGYKLAVIMTGATFTEDDGVYEITPDSAGTINIIAQRAVELA